MNNKEHQAAGEASVTSGKVGGPEGGGTAPSLPQRARAMKAAIWPRSTAISG